MRAVTLVCLLSVILKYTEGGIWTKCEIKGLDDSHWLLSSYQIKTTINDTYEGIVATFETKNIEGMKIEEGKYLNATLENEILKISTTEAFKNFEEEIKDSYDKRLFVKIEFSCKSDRSSLTIYQKVDDINNHDPVLSQSQYEYNFATTIPEDFDLSTLLPISAYDGDFTNENIYFTIETNEDLKLTYKGQTVKNEKDAFTSLTVLKKIEAPFKREFTLIATDSGKPTKNTTAKLTVNVFEYPEENTSSENGNDNETSVHPPVFGKHLYICNYTSTHELKMQEPIIVKYGAQSDMVVRQSGYNEYFQVQIKSVSRLSSGELQVQVVKQLPDVFSQMDFIVIEIEAENPGLKIPGRTALLIRLSTVEGNSQEGSNNNTNSDDNLQDCGVVHLWGFSYSNSVIPIIFSATALVIIIFLNIIVITLYLRRQNRNLVVPVQAPVTSSNA